VTVGAALLAYAAMVVVLGRLAHRHDGWLARAPRLGSVLLLAAAGSVLTAIFFAGLTIALPGTALSSGLSRLLGACILRLRAAYVTPGGAAVAGAGLTLSGALAVRVGWASAQVVRTRRAERRRQGSLLALCGRQAAELDALILDQPQPAAYCLAGRAHTVILTSGALDLLTGPQLAAVLAHERAHLGARHHRLLAGAALAARALPELPFMRELPRQVRRLLEMHADELAARTHDPETLATALVAVATARSGLPRVGTSSATLAAADGDTVTRIRRLLLPPATLTSRRRRTVRAGVAALGLLPLLVALTPAAVAATEPPVRPARTVTTVRHAAAVAPTRQTPIRHRPGQPPHPGYRPR
jgi:Zn-dependent protease with chaperone function